MFDKVELKNVEKLQRVLSKSLLLQSNSEYKTPLS
jgi:hypothetical protein